MLDSRQLGDSLSFDDKADSWAESRGILSGGASTALPVIIGMPSGSEDLGGFDIGVIQDSRTVKQAFQDLENAVFGKLSTANNFSDVVDKATARINLELGSASTRNVGTSGGVVPLLNAINTWSGKQTFDSGLATTRTLDISGSAALASTVSFFTGANRRWAINKTATNETGSNVGSDFNIVRYDDAGAFVENALSIVRSTGVVTLGKPLPIGSGGTGAADLVTFKTSLNLGNVDNTRDIDKPISTLTQAAISAKLDRVGGTVTGNLTSDGYLKASTTLIVSGGSTEGGQVVLGYKNINNLVGQGNGSWNIDVDTDNGLRIFTQRNNGSTPDPYLTISELGVFSAQSPRFSGLGQIGIFTGTSVGRNHGVSIVNLGTTGSLSGSGYVDFRNEQSVPTAHFMVNQNSDGSTTVDIGVTASGSRADDRRTDVIRFGSSSIVANVPIDGRAYPRRSDGANFNFIWSIQSGTPAYLIGSANGTDVYPYNPSSISVSKLANIDGGNSGGYVRRTDDASANGNLSSQIVVAGSEVTNNVGSAPIEIREVNKVGSAQSVSQYAPALMFNWSGRASSAIKMHSDGTVRFQTSNTTVTYQHIWSQDVNSTGWLRQQTDAGLFWQARGRGINVSDSGSGYGNITTVGSGLNSWQGYSIGTWATFMANGTECGIFSQAYGNWLLRFDASRNAIFAQNVTAYSDERLKQNKRPIDDVASRRRGMAEAAIIYEKEDITFIGFGAQTLEKSNPEVVTTADDLLGTKMVSYSQLIAVLAVDNQMLSDEIGSLKEENNILKNQMADILARLEKAGL